MATNNQRAIAIIDAVVNGTSTTQQRQRVQAAFSVDESGLPIAGDPAALLIAGVRDLILKRVKQAESRSAVQAAYTSAVSAVDTDFTEAP